MRTRHWMGPVSIAALALVVGLTAACSASPGETSPTSAADQDLLAGGSSGQAGGLAWTAPAGWLSVEAGAMRAASYRVPGSGEDVDGDMSVSHFPGSGGGEDANIQRWIGQFSAPDGGPVLGTKKGHKRIAGFTVTTLEVAGTYRGGPSRAGGPLAGYRLLAAIVQAPEGAVFFKLTGPAATVTAAADGYHAMLGSMRAAAAEQEAQAAPGL